MSTLTYLPAYYRLALKEKEINRTFFVATYNFVQLLLAQLKGCAPDFITSWHDNGCRAKQCVQIVVYLANTVSRSNPFARPQQLP